MGSKKAKQEEEVVSIDPSRVSYTVHSRDPDLDAAEASKLNAEADAASAQARKTVAEAELVELQLWVTEREEADSLSRCWYTRTFHFTAPVDQSAVAACIDATERWQKLDPKAPITIILTSPGGSVIPGVALFDHILALRSRGCEVIIVVRGYAASMAAILLQAGSKRVMGPQSYLLIHEVSAGTGGKMGEMEDDLGFYRMLQGRIVDIFATRSKLTKKEIRDKWRRKDWWLDSTEAMKLGLVDEIG